MNRRWSIVALLLAAGIAAAFLGRRELEWKWGALGQQGPFRGQPYRGELPAEPASRVDITPHVIAETFDPPESEASVLRVTTANSSWACLLVGTAPGTTNRIPICTARLRGARRWDSGYKILYKAEWDVSGSESGTIYLSQDMTLDHFTMR